MTVLQILLFNLFLLVLCWAGERFRKSSNQLVALLLDVQLQLLNELIQRTGNEAEANDRFREMRKAIYLMREEK